MDSNATFYLCAICFEAREADGECHSRRLIRCEAGSPGDERRRPPTVDGRLASRAPQWFLEAVGWAPASRRPVGRASS